MVQDSAPGCLLAALPPPRGTLTIPATCQACSCMCPLPRLLPLDFFKPLSPYIGAQRALELLSLGPYGLSVVGNSASSSFTLLFLLMPPERCLS